MSAIPTTLDPRGIERCASCGRPTETVTWTLPRTREAHAKVMAGRTVTDVASEYGTGVWALSAAFKRFGMPTKIRPDRRPVEVAP